MSLDEIRRRARDFHEESRNKALMGIVLGLCLSFVFAWSALKAPALLTRAGWAVLSLWGVWGAYYGYRWIWPGRLAPDGLGGTSVEFYRRELEKRRDHDRRVWWRSGLPLCFLGVALVVGPPLSKGFTWNAAPFFVLLAVWFVTFLTVRKRGREKLQREIDELKGSEG